MTQESDEYQGYTNRETWAAHLHLANDEWLYNLATETVALAGQDAPMAGANRLQEVVADLIEVNRNSTPAEATAVLTMMDREVGSWWRVNWAEVADGFRDE